MILDGECGAFNPKLLECFMEVKDTLNEEIQLAHAKERGQPLPAEDEEVEQASVSRCGKKTQ